MSVQSSCSLINTLEDFTRYYAIHRRATGQIGPRNAVIKYLAARNSMITNYHLGYIQSLIRITEEDAATAALAVGWVMKCRGKDVKFCTNGSHVFLGCNGQYYDVLNTYGTARESDVFGYRQHVPTISLPFANAFEKYMTNDDVGVLLLHGFINHAKVPSFLFRHQTGASNMINFMEMAD